MEVFGTSILASILKPKASSIFLYSQWYLYPVSRHRKKSNNLLLSPIYFNEKVCLKKKTIYYLNIYDLTEYDILKNKLNWI